MHVASRAALTPADASALALPPTTKTSKSSQCWWTNDGCTKPKESYLSNDFTTCKEPATWGVSIDDGPLAAHKNFYDLLTQNNIAPTLFYIGSNVQASPQLAAEGLALGGPVCVHTWSHQLTTSLTNEQVFAELYYTKLIIKRALGYVRLSSMLF